MTDPWTIQIGETVPEYALFDAWLRAGQPPLAKWKAPHSQGSRYRIALANSWKTRGTAWTAWHRGVERDALREALRERFAS